MCLRLLSYVQIHCWIHVHFPIPNFMSLCHWAFFFLSPIQTALHKNYCLLARASITQALSSNLLTFLLSWQAVTNLTLLNVWYHQDHTWNKRQEGSLGTPCIHRCHIDDNWRSPPASVCCETKPQAIWVCSCSSLCCVYHINDGGLFIQILAACEWTYFWCWLTKLLFLSISVSGLHSNSIPSV